MNSENTKSARFMGRCFPLLITAGCILPHLITWPLVVRHCFAYKFIMSQYITTLDDIYNLNFSFEQFDQIKELYSSQTYIPIHCDKNGGCFASGPMHYYTLEQIDLREDQVQKLKDIGDKRILMVNAIAISIALSLILITAIALTCCFIKYSEDNTIKVETLKDYFENFGKYVTCRI